MAKAIPLDTASTTPIFLTQFYHHDIETLPSLLSVPALVHRLIAIPQPYTQADAEWWVNLQMSGKSNLPLQVLRAGHPETGQMIGAVSLMPKDSEASQAIMTESTQDVVKTEEIECELGYYLHTDWQGKRIMTVAVKALLRWAKEEHGIGNVIVKIAEENGKSRSVVERLGDAFVRCEKEDCWEEWPETKGGGRRKLLVWRWPGSFP